MTEVVEDTTAPEATEATESVEVVADTPEEAAPEEVVAEEGAVEEIAAPADDALEEPAEEAK